MNNTLSIIKIVILSIILVVLTGIFILMLNSNFKFKFKFNTNSKLVFDKNIEEEFNKIKMDTNSLDIKFEKSDSDISNVKIYDNDDKDISVYVSDNTLNIEGNKKNVCVLFCFASKREAIITLPAREYDLIVNSKSGDINSKVDFKSVNIETKSGDVNLQNIDNASINAMSGDINVLDVGSIDANSKSGDINIKNIREYIKAETISGDVLIDNINITNDSNIKVTSGDVKINKASDNIYFDTKVTSGDVKIDNNNRKADYELSIKTVSGDIIVKNS